MKILKIILIIVTAIVLFGAIIFVSNYGRYDPPKAGARVITTLSSMRAEMDSIRDKKPVASYDTACSHEHIQLFLESIKKEKNTTVKCFGAGEQYTVVASYLIGSENRAFCVDSTGYAGSISEERYGAITSAATLCKVPTQVVTTDFGSITIPQDWKAVPSSYKEAIVGYSLVPQSENYPYENYIALGGLQATCQQFPPEQGYYCKSGKEGLPIFTKNEKYHGLVDSLYVELK
jgi:hypothetical protein